MSSVSNKAMAARTVPTGSTTSAAGIFDRCLEREGDKSLILHDQDGRFT